MTSSTGSAGVFEPQQVYPLKAAFSTDLFLIPVQETICSKDTHCVFKAFGPSLMARHFQSPLRSSNELSFFFLSVPLRCWCQIVMSKQWRSRLIFLIPPIRALKHLKNIRTKAAGWAQTHSRKYLSLLESKTFDHPHSILGSLGSRGKPNNTLKPFFPVWQNQIDGFISCATTLLPNGKIIPP